MKVNVSTTIDVDPEAWALEFGIERAEVPKDVKVYFEQTVQDHLDTLGLGMRPQDARAS